MSVSVDYYHFLISPWSYLSIERLNAIRARTGATIRYLPIDVGRTFGDMGGTPPAKRHPSRQSWRLEELERYSKLLNVPMNLQPKFFPADQSQAAKLVLAANELGDAPAADGSTAASRLSDAVLTACWKDEADIADRDTLSSIVSGLGLDADALLASSGSDAIAARYTTTTDEAHARGVFGSPTLIVGEERFWGQDRLDFAEAAIKAAG